MGLGLAEHLDSPDNARWVALDSDRVVGFVLGSMEFEHRDDWANLEPEPDSTDDALPAVPLGTKRALIRRGRLAGEGRGAR